MKRIDTTIYTNDAGRELVTLMDGRAKIHPFECTPDDLLELARACKEAAVELENLAAAQPEVSR